MDPFILIVQELNTDLDSVRNKLDTREDMIHDPRGINMNIFENLGKEIEQLLTKIKSSMIDVDSVIDKLQTNGQEFQLPEIELQNRINFSQTMKEEIKKLENQLIQQKNNQNLQKRVNFADRTSNFGSTQSDDNEGNQSMQLYEENQDIIDSISDNVTAGLIMSRTINKELEDHQKLLADLDGDVDNATEAMKKVTDQIKEIIESEGTTPTCVVALLSIAFIVLLFFVI